MTFNLSSSSSGSVLVEAAHLVVSLNHISAHTVVRVSQVTEEGEISLDRGVTGGAGGEREVLSLQLEVSHAVAGWLAQPHTNLGLRLSLDSQESQESQERLEVARAELVLHTRETSGLVRRRRETAGLVSSRTDCRAREGKRNKCCR